MALRVSFNNQMYKVPKLPTDLTVAADVVSFLFGAELQQGWVLEYLDPKEGPIALTDEEAFKKLQKNMWASKKPVKLNVRFTGALEQNNTRTNEERPGLPSMNTTMDTIEARRETQTTINDALTTDTQSHHISEDEQEEAIESEEQSIIESEIESINNSRNKRKDKHRDLKQLRATLQKTLDSTKAQETQSQSESAPMLAVALQLRKPKRNPGSSSGKSQSLTGQNSRQIIRDMHLHQKNIIDLLAEDEENDDEDDSYEGNSTTANEKSKSLKQMYDSEIEEKVIRIYDIFPDKDLKDLRRFVSPIHYLPIETLIEKFLAC